MKDIKLWAEVCGIKELFDIEPYNLNDDRIARGLDELAQYFEEIETKLSINIIREFNLNPEEILWDTTSIYFEGDYDEAEIVQFGYGDKPDLKQIKLALNVEKDSGVSLRGSVIKGNLNDPSIVVENMKKLRNHLNKQDILFTGDNAVGTIPNCLLLNKNNMLKKSIEVLNKAPEEVAADRGFYSSENEEEIQSLKVKHVAIPKPGKKNEKRIKHERQHWFKRLIRWRSGGETTISLLKRQYGLNECLFHGENTGIWVNLSIFIHNVSKLAKLMAQTC